MYVTIGATFTHVLFNYIFVFVFPLGVLGTGISAGLTNGFMAFLNMLIIKYHTNLGDKTDISICF